MLLESLLITSMFVGALAVALIKKLSNRPPTARLNNHSLKEEPKYKTFKQLSKSYGNLFSAEVDSKTVLVANSHEVVKELYDQGDTFSGRSPNFTLDIVSQTYQAAFHKMHTHRWKLMRSVGHQALVKHGVKKDKFKEILETEATTLEKKLAENSGKLIDPSPLLMLAIVNVTAQVLFSERFSLTDEKFKSIEEILNTSFNDETSCQAQHSKEKHRFEKVLEDLISKARDNYKQNGVTNVASAIIHELDEKHSSLSDKDELAYTIIFEVFVSSLEPIFATLCWALIYITRWNHIQEKIQSEICSDDKKDRTANYLQAVLHETLRYATVVPMYPRMSTNDALLAGYKIPKGSTLLINNYALHYDEKIWNQPNDFNPLRWLDAEGKFKRLNSSSFIPFGGGKRRCFGEIMAKEEILYFLKNVLNAFEFQESSTHEHNLQAKEGTFNVPGPFKVLVKRRNLSQLNLGG